VSDEFLQLESTTQDDEKHPPHRKSDIPLRSGIIEFISPLRGDSRRGVPFSFLFHHFSHIPIFTK